MTQLRDVLAPKFAFRRRRKNSRNFESQDVVQCAAKFAGNTIRQKANEREIEQ
jgi:hypothetical protein